MKFCAYGKERKIGVLDGDNKVHQIKLPSNVRDMKDLISTYSPTIKKAASLSLKRQAVKGAKLEAPLAETSAIWAAVKNYSEHAKEMAAGRGAEQLAYAEKAHEEMLSELFLKPPTSIVGPNSTVKIPSRSKWVDFECELGVVIGKSVVKALPRDRALDCVFGYTIMYDITQRDPLGSRSLRKGYRGFTPMGPCIVTKDEVEDPQNLSIKVLLNGKPQMDGSTSGMICRIDEIIAYLSETSGLAVGDVISTGTPAGVSRIQAGDTLEATIEKIGNLNIKISA